MFQYSLKVEINQEEIIKQHVCLQVCCLHQLSSTDSCSITYSSTTNMHQLLLLTAILLLLPLLLLPIYTVRIDSRFKGAHNITTDSQVFKKANQ